MNEPTRRNSNHSAILNQRLSGILLHPSSLPGGHGIGDLGKGAFEFVDFLRSARQSVWQVLPMGPTTEEEFHSPYSSVSAFAGNPLLISLEHLVAEGLLEKKAIERRRRTVATSRDQSQVDFRSVVRFKTPLLQEAAANFQGRLAERALSSFTKSNPWASEYAIYAALRERFGGPRETWPHELRLKPGQSARVFSQFVSEEEIRRHLVIQLLFARQWEALRAYARRSGVHLFGDLPIYVSNDSADVWGSPQFFEVDRKTGRPTLISGVPPDAYNADGQLWGHPLYNWKALQKDQFRWWVARFRAAQHAFDIVRVDHFRGFESYWGVKAGSKTAKNGQWMKCPGEAMFEAVRRSLGELPIFVEDLGLITPPVHALRERFGLMGTRVLQFAFGGDVNNTSRSRHHPINTPHHSVVYSATHDNAPTAEWFADLPKANKLKLQGLLNDCSVREVPEQFVRLAMSLPARLTILFMQDVLGVGKGHRMNRPGVADWKNWSWRLQAIPEKVGPRLAHLSEIYERNSSI